MSNKSLTRTINITKLRPKGNNRLAATNVACQQETLAVLQCLNGSVSDNVDCAGVMDTLKLCMSQSKKVAGQHKPTDTYHLLRIAKEQGIKVS
jgi:hypothetical protein